MPSGANFPARTQFDGQRRQVLRAHGKSIAGGAMKRRIIPVRHNVLRQDSAARRSQRQNFRPRPKTRRGQLLFNDAKRPLEGKHGILDFGFSILD
jgi:hypothetical protein